MAKVLIMMETNSELKFVKDLVQIKIIYEKYLKLTAMSNRAKCKT